ncbi:MAG: hypothetical protein LH629_11735, partial [Ignavibacteria bacterium]|nr:hypothetical protein [Ignavibacteria bacterium]
MKILVFIISLLMMFNPGKQEPKKIIKYIAFGDSYTICTGTNSDAEHWPYILTKHLNEAGIATELT